MRLDRGRWGDRTDVGVWVKGQTLLARLGQPIEESRFKLHSIDAASTNWRRWWWYEISQGKRNQISCTCHRGSVHTHRGDLHQIFTLGTCDHTRALYEGRVTPDARSATRTVYRVIFTKRGEELFNWRLAAHMLLRGS